MEELRLPLEEVKQWIHDLYFFLHCYQDISSAHSVDFFTHDHWEIVIKSNWREELLATTREEQFVQPSKGGSPGILNISTCTCTALIKK